MYFRSMVAPLAIKLSEVTTITGAEKKMYAQNKVVINAATGNAAPGFSGNITAMTLGKSSAGKTKAPTLGNTRSR